MIKKFCVGTNFKNDLLEKLSCIEKKYKNNNVKISEVYGSFATSLLGSARPAFSLPKISSQQLKRHIEKAKEFGYEFNYLVNSSCLGNVEYTYSGRKKIIDFVNQLTNLGVKKLTVTIPHLMEIIKERFPNLQVATSVISCIDSVDKALFYEGLGAGVITLDFSVNRNFTLLKEIRKKVKVELEVLLNDLCLIKCPLKCYHYNYVGHLTQDKYSKNDYFAEDPIIEKCCYLRVKDIKEFIKSPWIRPEDVDEYTKIGIDYFKISSRDCPTVDILFRAEAYLSGNYYGNFTSIINFSNPQFEGEEKLEIEIDNKLLDGFLKYFLEGNCNYNCFDCNYCENIANKVIKINEERRVKYLKLFEDMFKKRLYIDLNKKIDKTLILDYGIKHKLKNFLSNIFKK